MITAFGKFCRKLRIDNGELLKDMAEKLNVTPSYLSAVETGKRTIPNTWVNIIKQVYMLTNEGIENLSKAVAESTGEVKMSIDCMSGDDRDLVLAFARKFESLDEKNKNMLKKLLK